LKIHQLIQIIEPKVNSSVEKNFTRHTSFDSDHSGDFSRKDNSILSNSIKSLNSTYLFGSVIDKESIIDIHETISTDKQNEFSFLKPQATPFKTPNNDLNVNASKKLKKKSNIFSYVLNPEYSQKFVDLISLFESIVNVKESSEPESKSCKRIHVNSNISNELDEKKLVYSHLSEYLNEVAKEQQLIYGGEQCTVLYALQIGFLIGIVYDENMLRLVDPSFTESSTMEIDEDNEYYESYIKEKDEKHFEELRRKFEIMNNLERKFIIDKRCYYKNDVMRELDFEHGDLGSHISDLEAQIIDSLQTNFVSNSHFYASMNDFCGELDCLLAFAAVARENDFVKPNVTIENR
jgi:DNA mismatch repair ATPase MutS